MLDPIHISDPESMISLGARSAKYCPPGCTVFLRGKLGTGKTTWVKGFLSEYDYTGPVKSPTYTLVEPYTFENAIIYHFDLFRLATPEELDGIDIRDYFDDHSIRLIEWPEIADNFLPPADIDIGIEYCPDSADQSRRTVTYTSGSDRGRLILSQIQSA